MNSARYEMSSIYCPQPLDLEGDSNITKRKDISGKMAKMAVSRGSLIDLEQGTSPLIEDILSRDEANDVVSMMIMADEINEDSDYPSFCTSSQMGYRNPRIRPMSPPLSPLMSATPARNVAGASADNKGAEGSEEIGSERKTSTEAAAMNEQVLNQVNSQLNSRKHVDEPMAGGQMGARGHDLFGTSRDMDVSVHNVTAVTMAPGMATNVATKLSRHESTDDVNKGVSEPAAEAGGDSIDLTSEEGSEGSEEEEGKYGDGDGEGEKEKEGAKPSRATKSELASISAKLEKMDAVLHAMNGNSTKFDTTVSELITSLEYSQKEIDGLKAENAQLKQKMGEIIMEDKRTQFQVNAIENKLDRIETTTKKKNLIIEGVPELEGRNENVEKTISVLFDQLRVHEGISYEGCYRIGSYIKSRTRPIMVNFERQADRDAIYAKRFELRRTHDFQRVWINEDLGALSKRKRGLIRLISKEAQAQGIDCKSGKYFVQIDDKRFDDKNLDELPKQLQLTSLKQVMVTKDAMAYQSEHAPFSNFFHCQIIIGKHKFFCLEQSFQFMKAKILDRPLAASNIYLSRDVRYIKQEGAELGTSEEWERRKYDVMYECLLRKFQQNRHLRQLLLKTGDLELLEATPDRLWGCGATLSSTVIRKGGWPGKNKQGKILMAVREELRRLEEDKQATDPTC